MITSGVVKCMNHEDCLGTNRECSFDGGHETHQNASGVSIDTILFTNMETHRNLKFLAQTCEWASASANPVLCSWGPILPAIVKVSCNENLIGGTPESYYDLT